jgi:hypothetical protein
MVLAVSLCSASVTLTSCAHSSSTARPGSINAFDSAAYDTLLIVQSSLEQASEEFRNHPTDPAYLAIKPEFNQAIDAYNSAQNAYKAYHLAGAGGDSAALMQAVTVVSQDVMKLLRKLPGGAR